jgi:dTDP-N-acetylfucosamine:lipid II N-acetylfucosaminyltransferase
MLVHVFNDVPHHYKSMVDFFSSLDANIDSCFLIQASAVGVIPESMKSREDVVVYSSDKELLTFLRNHDYKRVVFHGMFGYKRCFKLILSIDLSKANWVCWGYDIYDFKGNCRTIKGRVKNLVKVLFARRLNKILCLNQGDKELVESQYNLDPSIVEVLPYPIMGLNRSKQPPIVNKVKKFLLGNSATASNNHIQLFESVKHLKDTDVEFIVPLNYGGKPEYVEHILNEGNRLLGGQFKPVLEMLDLASYVNLLAQVDVALFAHDRQQGLFVAYYMLLHGKKLYLKSLTSSFSSFFNAGFNVFDLASVSQNNLKEVIDMSDVKRDENINLTEEMYTEKALSYKWLNFMQRIT